MKKTEKEARRLHKALHGQINFESLTDYIEKQGYSVILFDDANKLIKRYSLEETAKTKSAFTYVDKTSKLIFIRESLHANDKLLQLLHEIGHITLDHLKGNYLKVTDASESEYQANHFAHLVLSPKTIPDYIRKTGTAILSIVLVISICFNISFITTKQTAAQSLHVPETVNTVHYVRITANGTKYHREDCIYAKNGIYVKLEDAVQLYSPCSSCNP